ncbi:H-NS histone family protein [Paraburkholderia sp. LEh10]|uniref:H-NS histone family protein n=1 Tax=Paraburkholderia sp. LEh10 TaxID=2821353 RepID=UPI001AE4B16E|nr:H-NS histone family protein [Paraburkholderia sp. LEh10]MBP0595351.1 H-NS histone family protein [Paraburkholderia sp. LEh10]
MDSYQDLVARMARLEVEIEKSRKAETAAAIDDILQRMTEYGITLGDIGERMKQGGRRTRARVEPKYRDPVSGKEWSGRGKAPRWIRDHADRERFLI